MTGEFQRLKQFFLLCLILSIGIILRIYKLDTYSLWTDEICFKGEVNINGLISGEYPLFYALQHLSVPFMLEHLHGEFLLRLPSVALGVISIFSIYYLSRLLFSDRVAIISAFLFSISPFQIYYSQELSPYAAVFLLTILSTYFFIKSLRENKKRFWFGYLILSIINIYLRITTILVLLGQVIYFYIFRRRYAHLLKRWLVVHSVLFILFLPMVLLFIKFLAYHSQSGSFPWVVSTKGVLGYISLIMPIFTIKNFLLGFNAKPCVFFLPLSISLYILFSEIRKINRNESITFCFLGLAIPLILMYILQAFIYADRLLISSSIFFYLILANGLSSMKTRFRSISLMLITITSFLSLRSYYLNDFSVSSEQRIAVHAKKEYKEAADFVYENFHEGDAIFHTHPNTVRPFKHYFSLRDDYNLYDRNIFDEDINGMLVLSFRNSAKPHPFDCLKAKFVNKSNEIDLLDYKRIWLFFSAHEFEKATQKYSNESRTVQWLDRNFHCEEVREFDGIIVKLYKPKQTEDSNSIKPVN